VKIRSRATDFECLLKISAASSYPLRELFGCCQLLYYSEGLS